MSEFIGHFVKRDQISAERFHQDFVALPCNCDAVEGIHWARVRLVEEQVLDHLAFHCPTQEELLMMAHEAIKRELAKR